MKCKENKLLEILVEHCCLTSLDWPLLSKSNHHLLGYSLPLYSWKAKKINKNNLFPWRWVQKKTSPSNLHKSASRWPSFFFFFLNQEMVTYTLIKTVQHSTLSSFINFFDLQSGFYAKKDANSCYRFPKSSTSFLRS